MLASFKMCLAAALIVAIGLLSGCSQSANAPAHEVTPAKASEAANPSGPVTARAAYLKMYESAFKWSPDVVLLSITPKEMPAANSTGKTMIWEANFASPSQHQYRTFIYAVAAQPPDIYPGVNIGHGVPWGGATQAVMPVASADFTVDSDAAYAAAAEDAAAWLKKNPNEKLTKFQLGNSYNYSAPVWFIMWGEKKSGYLVYVNATDGKVMKK